MNRQKAKELLPLIQAFVVGKTVQRYELAMDKWVDDSDPVIFSGDRYRIKPEPREFWICNATSHDGSAHYWITNADKASGQWDRANPIKVREVIEE